MMEARRIEINKIGKEHIFFDVNNQDSYFSSEEVKVVMDGCGSMPSSEVGTRLYSQFLQYYDGIKPSDFEGITKNIFQEFRRISPDDNFFSSNFLFTILACFEMKDEFIVFSCGDGYIITQKEEEISFLKLDDGEYPKYYGYNFIENKKCLDLYKDGVDFEIRYFSKKEYTKVGVATDGLRFYEELNHLEKNKLLVYFLQGKKAQIAMLINRNKDVFKDDITICF